MQTACFCGWPPSCAASSELGGPASDSFCAEAHGWLVFCSLLLQYDKDNISEKVRRELRRIISDPAFTPDQVRT